MPFDINYIYAFAGLFVFGIFLIKRDWLFKRKSFNVILVITVLLFLTGLIIRFIEQWQTSFSFALLTPLLSLVIFRLYLKLFLMIKKREPKNTFHRWDDGENLGADRLFNAVFGMSNFLLIMVALFITEFLKKIGL